MVCPDRWLGAVPKRPSSCVWTLGVTSTNVPPSPATFWPFAAANRQNAIATRARPRPGRGGATPREGPEPPRADEAERADISRLCRRDIHFRHLTGQRRASSVCPFFLLIMSLFGVVFTASFGNAKRKNGGRPEATRCAQTTEGVFVCLSLFPHRVSYERQSHENSFCTFTFSKLRRFEDGGGYFVSTRIAFPPDGTCPARLHERRTRSPFQAQARRPSRSNASLSNFYVRRLSALGCAQSPRTAPFQGYSEVSRPRRQVHRYVRPSPFPARERSPRSRRASRVLPRRRLSGGRASPRDSGASLVRRVGEKISPDVSHKKQSRDHAVSRLRPPASPPDAGLRVRAMAAEDKSRIGLCGLAVMGQVRLSPPHDAPFGSAERGHRAS